jgi:2'-5' RNA ligase
METYRLFIAAELPLEVKAELSGAQERLRRGGPPVRWVAPAAMHLTLKFLGETDAALLDDLGAAMRGALAGTGPIALRLGAAGAFPSLGRPNVLWVGVGGEVAALARAAARLDEALAGMGIAREQKPFRAHLTLGRVRREATREQQERLGAAVRELPPGTAEWTVDRVVLFRSELRREGPVYSEIADSRLQIAH